MHIRSALSVEMAATLEETDKVLYDVADHIATVTLNRPDKLNAMDPEVYAALSEAWIQIRDDSDVWAGIVTSSGEEAFSSGADLDKTVRPGEHDWDEFWKTQQEPLLNRGMEMWKPVIAAVNGHCLGGGMTLLLATDIRVAGEHASFGLSEIKRGLLPGNGGIQRTIRQLPRTKAMELLLTGEPIDAEQAYEWDLVNEVVPPGEVLSTAEAYAERILSNGPLAVQAVKELALRGQDMALSDGIRLERSFFEHLAATEDAREGVSAFHENRTPEWKGK